MITISRFAINGKTSRFTFDKGPLNFSFVVDFDKVISVIDKITLKVNGHEIDVTDKTHYLYDFDDLTPLTTYEAELLVFVANNVISKKISFDIGLPKWNYHFITDPKYTFKEKHVSPKVMSFKKNFDVNKEILDAKIYITAFGVYNLYINEKKINNEFLLPGFTSYKHQLQYQTFDVTNVLKQNNEILVDVAGGWAVGSFVMNRVNRISDKKQSLSACLLIKYRDNSTEVISTDNSWEVSTDTPYIYADLYDGEGFDATKERINFHPASIYKTKCHPQILADYGAPIIKKKTLIPTFIHKINDVLYYDLKQNMAGVLLLKIKNAKRGQLITIHHAEILNKDNTLNISFLRSAKCEINYICKEGDQIYIPSFTYMGFRYFSVEGIKKEDIDIEAIVLSSDIEEISSFECDNKLINRLNQNIYWSSISNFMDIPTDCPQRDERMGWTGDIAVFAPTGLFNFEMTSFLNKWLKDLRSEQLITGGLPNTVPVQGYGFPITMPKMAIDFWGDASLLVPFALYRSTGDITILKENYKTMKKYVNACLFWAHLFSIGSHRYIWHTPSIFHFGDWIAPDVDKMSLWQSRSIYTATCSLRNTTNILANVAKILGFDKEYDKYSKISNKVSNAFNKILTNKKGILKKEFQTGYVLPIYFDMFSAANKKIALERLVNIIKENNYHIGTGFPGTPYILFALADNGYQDVAYKMLLTDTCPSWLYEVKVGGTTIWERWDGLNELGECPINNDGTGGMISYNHYASGAVGYFLYSRLAGIEMIEPGYKKFQVKPLIVNTIKKVKTSTLTPFGKIEVVYSIEDNFIINVRVPLRTKCNLFLPDGTRKELSAGTYKFECNL